MQCHNKFLYNSHLDFFKTKSKFSKMCSRAYKLLLHSANQVVQVVKNHELVVTGKNMKEIAILERNISIVVNREGYIEDIGPDGEIAQKYKDAEFEHQINATGMCIIPGLVDAHTHPVWAGDRVHEFAMKLAGATYMDIHKAGGGIHFTVEHTRKATEDELLQLLLERLERMLKCGTTLVEAKSGYGLDLESEMKLLKVIERARKLSNVEISSTFCGAHAIPKGLDAETATDAIISMHIPELQMFIERRALQVDSIDVFCDEGVFNLDQSRRILEAGRNIGLRLNFHGDELTPIQAAEMGAELKAEAISHLEEISDAGIKAMSKAGTVAIALPTTAYMLRLKPPPVRKMVECGVPVALGSDFNPNAFCLSMPLVMHLACVNLHMSMPESLVASTINAAAALGKSSTHGSLEVGKMADMVIVGASRWEHLIYQMGGQDHLIKYVVKKGEIVYNSS